MHTGIHKSNKTFLHRSDDIPCNATGHLPKESGTSHTLYTSRIYIGHIGQSTTLDSPLQAVTRR